MGSLRSRVAIIAVSAVVAIIFGGQVVGAWLGYPAWLGLELIHSGSTAIYWPGALIWFATHNLSAVAPNAMAAGIVSAAVIWFAAVILAAIFGKAARGKVKEFGRDAWGTRKDARDAGLLKRTMPDMPGVISGRWLNSTSPDDIFNYDGPEHHLITGASRAGKGVGHVIPTLLSWKESAFVYDPKEECYDITAEFRRKHVGHVFFLNFTRRDSACFNPLFEVRRGDFEIADAQNVAGMLVDPGGIQNSLDFFQTSAKELLTAIILHVLYAAPLAKKNLAEVRRCVLDIKATLEAMIDTLHLGDRPHTEVRLIGERYSAMGDKVKDSILATCSTCLELYADPIVAQLSSRSDFTVGDLVCAPLPVTCYLQTPPSDATRLRPLTRLILSQVAQSLTNKLDEDQRGRKKKRRLLYLVDEFPTLGRLGFFSTNLRIMAGYGIKAMIIVQSFKDIMEAYGRDNTIIDNCHVVVAFATADSDTAKRISEMTGRAVEIRMSHSESSGLNGRRSTSYQEVQRNLLESGDVRTLPYDQQLVFVTGTKPFRTSKLRYFEEPIFKARMTDIRKGGRGPSQAHGPDVPYKLVQHDWTGFPLPAPTARRAAASPAAAPPAALVCPAIAPHSEPLDEVIAQEVALNGVEFTDSIYEEGE